MLPHADDDLVYASATDVLAGMDAGKLTSVEMLERLLLHIERENVATNAVVTLAVAQARLEAAAADVARRDGRTLGPLHGLPMTVKDSFQTAGIRTTSGANELADYVPTSDADVVTRLRAAGAIVFGKTNLATYAGDIQTANEVFGATNNPWAAGRTPGGSSGGSAAAIATGMTPLEMGSDTGGSIRVPAAWCGVFGLKPSFGVVSGGGHIPPRPGEHVVPDMAVVGPLARDANDLELALAVIAGPAPRDAIAWSLGLPPPLYTSVRQLRVAVCASDPACRAAAEVSGGVQLAASTLDAAGASVEEAELPVPFDDAYEVFAGAVGAASSVGIPSALFRIAARVADRKRSPDDSPLIQGARHVAIRHRDWLQLAERRVEHRLTWGRFFERFDILLCPVASTVAPRHDERPYVERTLQIDGREADYPKSTGGWCGIVTAASLPAVAAPVGVTPAGLPLAVQIVAPYLADRTAIAVAGVLQQRLGWTRPRLAPPTAQMQS